MPSARPPGEAGGRLMNKTTKYNTLYAIAAVIGIIVLQYVLFRLLVASPIVIPYSEFRNWVDHDKVAEVNVSTDGNRITGALKQPLPNGTRYFVTTPVPQDLAADLERHGVKFTGVTPDNFWTNLVSWVVPILLFFGLWHFAFRGYANRAGMPGLMSIGKSKAKVYVETDIRTTFADVAGAAEAKEELKEIVGFLKDPDRYARLGGRVPKGVLLVGPPGTGKTLLARAVAGEAGVPFFSISGSEFVEMFVGVGAARVRDLFEQARQKAPAIIFIDELDAIGKARVGRGAYIGHDEREQTLNQLLVEMDGFDSSSGVIIMGATNQPEVLDPALVRPGRFDRQIVIDRPDVKGREEILKVHVKKMRLGPDVDLSVLAARTPGMVGADLANIVNEAALAAARRGADFIAMRDFESAIDRVTLGFEKKRRLMNSEEKERVARHEAGHAMVALALPHADPVHRISIVPRSIGALGHTLQLPTAERYLLTQPELEDRLAVMLGGRAAEEIAYDGIVSTGASDDLERASELARQMITRFGMSSELGLVTYGRRLESQFLRG